MTQRLQTMAPPSPGEPHRLFRRYSKASGVVYVLVMGPGWVVEVSRDGVRAREPVPASLLFTIGGVLEHTQDELEALGTDPTREHPAHRCPDAGPALVCERLRIVGLRIDAYREVWPSEGGEGWVRIDNPSDYLGCR